MTLIFVKVKFTPVSKKKENKGRSKSSTASPHGEPELEKTHSETKVPILKVCHFGKVKLWDVEHFWTLFVFIFGRDC